MQWARKNPGKNEFFVLRYGQNISWTIVSSDPDDGDELGLGISNYKISK